MKILSSLPLWRVMLCGCMALSLEPMGATEFYQGIPPLPSQIPTTPPLGLRQNSARQARSLQNVAAQQLPEVKPQEVLKNDSPAQHAPGPVPSTTIPPNTRSSTATGTNAEGCGPCGGAPCIPYLRNRPDPHGNQGDRIRMYNRKYEPNWYRYYRCCHYGYHPTQWAAWPEGWLTCRHPQPGPHPYDYQPPKPDKKLLDRERSIQEGQRNQTASHRIFLKTRYCRVPWTSPSRSSHHKTRRRIPGGLSLQRIHPNFCRCPNERGVSHGIDPSDYASRETFLAISITTNSSPINPIKGSCDSRFHAGGFDDSSRRSPFPCTRSGPSQALV